MWIFILKKNTLLCVNARHAKNPNKWYFDLHFKPFTPPLICQTRERISASDKIESVYLRQTRSKAYICVRLPSNHYWAISTFSLENHFLRTYVHARVKLTQNTLMKIIIFNILKESWIKKWKSMNSKLLFYSIKSH